MKYSIIWNLLGNDSFIMSESSSLRIDQYSKKYKIWTIRQSNYYLKLPTRNVMFIMAGSENLANAIYNSNFITDEMDYFLTFMKNGYAHIKIDNLEDLEKYYKISQSINTQLEELFPIAEIIFVFDMPKADSKDINIGYISDFNK